MGLHRAGRSSEMATNRVGWGRMGTCADSYESEGQAGRIGVHGRGPATVRVLSVNSCRLCREQPRARRQSRETLGSYRRVLVAVTVPAPPSRRAPVHVFSSTVCCSRPSQRSTFCCCTAGILRAVHPPSLFLGSPDVRRVSPGSVTSAQSTRVTQIKDVRSCTPTRPPPQGEPTDDEMQSIDCSACSDGFSLPAHAAT